MKFISIFFLIFVYIMVLRFQASNCGLVCLMTVSFQETTKFTSLEPVLIPITYPLENSKGFRIQCQRFLSLRKLQGLRSCMSCTKIKHRMLGTMILLVPLLTGILGALHQEPGTGIDLYIYIFLLSHITYPDMYI